MSLMRQLLDDRIYNFLKFDLKFKKNNKKIYKFMSESYLIQAKNIFALIYKDKSISNKLKSEKTLIMEFFPRIKKGIKNKQGKEHEKLVDWSENISKMNYMILENYKEKPEELTGLYLCENCGWMGKDEIVERCPLCNKTDFIR